MNGTTKSWLIAAAALVLIGLLLLVGVMARGHWELLSFGASGFRTETVEITDSFRDISIETGTEDIALLPSEDGKCRVVFYEPEKTEPTASVRAGTLSITVTDTSEWYDHIYFFSFASPKITVYLPESGYALLSIKESTGDVSIPNDFTFGSIDVSVSTGDVDCFASASGTIRIAADTGDIRAEEITAGDLALSVSTGDVSVRSAACEGGFGVSVSTGKAALAGVSCGSFRSDGGTGDIFLRNVIAAETITIRRSTGDVRLENCDAAGLLIETSTGDVTGSLLSDKVFITQSSTGDISVPGSATGGQCRITTSTGEIAFTAP